MGQFIILPIAVTLEGMMMLVKTVESKLLLPMTTTPGANNTLLKTVHP
jgi:hypothetical protein